MERLKAQYHEEKSAYFSHNSSHSSMDVSGMSHQNQYKHQQQHRGHFHNSSISSMNSSFTDMSPTRIIQPMVSNGNGRGGLSEDGFTDSTHPRPGLHHTSGTGVYHHGSFVSVLVFYSFAIRGQYGMKKNTATSLFFCTYTCLYARRFFCPIMSAD